MLVQKIIQNDTIVYLGLDADAKKKELEIIKLLLKYDIEVYKVDTSGYDDIAEMSKSVFRERKQTATLVIIKGVAGLVGGDDSEKDAAALNDKSQLDPIVIKSQELQAIQQLLQSIEAKISELASSSSTDEMPSPTARDATAKASAPSPASTSEPSKV